MTNKGFSFPPHYRLRTANDYKTVFTSNPIKSSDKYLTLLAVPNQLTHPRLGLAIAKKNVKRAVDRNVIKRLARESFRLQQHQLINIDIVVLARRDAAHISSEKLKLSLEKHWLRLINRCG